MEQFLWLIPVGFIVGAYGTLIGAGGGFLLVPLLLLFYPSEDPQTITSISLAVVFFNAFSGSVAYGRAKRIDYYSGTIFSIATVPGAVLGALSTSFIPRRIFDLIVGILMLACAVFLFWRPAVRKTGTNSDPAHYFSRHVVEADGTRHDFSYRPVVGVGLSLMIGYISSLLGIGGGFIHVPVLVHLLNFPVHVATATSQFILAIMSFSGTVTHVVTGAFQHGIRRTIFLSVGVVVGAQLGASLSSRVRGDWIIRSLAIALAFVGLRLIGTILLISP